jgi:N-alpha-acetyltransferase 38, NatC auxiliary subunit
MQDTDQELTTVQNSQDRNIILSRTYEYRRPSSPVSAPSSSTEATEAAGEAENKTVVSETKKVFLDMTSRYLGLVVVPGEFITKIDVEEFASQIKAGGSKYADLAVGAV